VSANVFRIRLFTEEIAEHRRPGVDRLDALLSCEKVTRTLGFHPHFYRISRDYWVECRS
jgi:hypothetical protein